MSSPPSAPGLPRLSVLGEVARIALDRADRHNALEAADVDRLLAHLDTVDADAAVRVLIVTGSGTATFCSGASLAQLETGEMSPGRFGALTERLALTRVPVVCAVNGAVFGGGVELALCCDFRIGVTGARMSVPAARLGLCYPLAGVRRIVRALGPAASARLLLAAEELGAEEMLAAGFLHRLVPPQELEPAASELAGRLAALAPLAVQGMKRLLHLGCSSEADEAEARALVERCERSQDLREGLAARRDRRQPSFGGR